MDPKHFHTTLDQRQADSVKAQQDKLAQEANAKNSQAIIDTIGSATKALIAFQKNHKADVNVQAQLDDSKIVAAVSKLDKSLANLRFPDIPKPATTVTVKNQPDYSKQFSQLSEDIKSIDVKPVVNVETPAEQPEDYTPVLEALKEVKDAIGAIHIPDFPEIPGVDLTEVVSATEAVQHTLENLKFPIPNYVLPFKNADGEATQVQLQSDGSLPITASISTGGLATSANQTNNSQTTQIVDSSGHAVTVTGNKLDVNATASLAGSSIPIASATTGVGVAILDSSGNQISSFGGGTQYTDGGTPPTHAIGSVPIYDSAGTWKSVSSTNKLPVNTGLTQPTTPSDTQPVSGTFWQATQPVSAASLPLPTGAATAAKQPALGTAGTPSADVVTVQGKTSMTPLLVDASATTQPISGTVTANAGTNLNTSALALDATLTGGTQQSKITDGTNVATVKAASTAAVATDKAVVVAVSPNNTVPVSGTFWQTTQPVSLATNTPTLQSGSTTAVTQGTATNLKAQAEAYQGGTAVGSANPMQVTLANTGANSTAVKVDGSAVTQPVSLASVPSHAVTNAGTFAIQNTTTTTTSTQTSVANSVTSVTLLALNTSRKSATIYNDDTAASLYVKFGTTASTTSYKIKIAPGGYYEFPYPIYTGRVDGIASAATGNARICEET